MAAVTLLGSTFNTTSGTHTVVATPAVGDMIIIIVASTSYSGGVAPTDNNSSGTYTGTSDTQGPNTGRINIYARNSLVSSATSTTFTHAPGTTTGGGLAVYSVSGMTNTGASAFRQSGSDSNGTAGQTPTPLMTGALIPLSGNPVITGLYNGSSPDGVTKRTGHTDDVVTNYATPTTGIHFTHILTGETTYSIAWGSTSATSWGAIAAEIAVALAPTVTSSAATNISTNSASASGNVTSDGGATVTERGIVWSTNANPTTANNKVIDGSGGTGAYTDTITGLVSGLTYHFRAYAINGVNTSYGSDLTFTTKDTININNYMFFKVGDGMSASEKIR